MLNRLVIATHNRKKAGEMVTILSQKFPLLTLETLADFIDAPEPEETGNTYEENSAIKSISAAKFTGEWCAADDAGLEIDALDGAPGVFSKRFGGEDLPFPEKISRILDLMRDVPTEKRTARFRCVVALSSPSNSAPPELFISTCEGQIADEVSGNAGFGYDPIFYLPQFGCTFADMTADEKHAVSHRGKVLKMLGDRLEAL
ncbi:XTP/dITP diphosphatase [soil metagenome]